MKLAISMFMLAATSTLASAEGVRHVPPADAEAGQNLELVAEAPASTPTLVAHVRARGTQPFTDIELVRKDNARWVAVVPAAAVVAPGLDYYVTAGDAPVFATPEWPHSIAVHVPADAERRTRDELRTGQRRSRIHALGEWVEYGTKTVNGTELADHYYRFDADFSYRLWTYPLEEIRVGYTRLLGDTLQAPDQMCPTTQACTAEAGFKVAGWFELGLAAVEGVRFDARMMVMATQQGFAVGGRGEARLGERDASHVALGVEYLAAVGTNGFFRLGWGTVPRLPMAATVEISNLPADHRPTGVRLYYDLGYDVTPGVRVGLRVGYAARNQSVAGFTGGGGASVEF
jgi:hypothetical protein